MGARSTRPSLFGGLLGGTLASSWTRFTGSCHQASEASAWPKDWKTTASPTATEMPNANRCCSALRSPRRLSSAVCPRRCRRRFTCAGDVGTGPAPISHIAINDFIICVNTEARTNAAGYAIQLSTVEINHFIDLHNSGDLNAVNVGNAFGIFAQLNGSNSPVSVENIGDITAISATFLARGSVLTADDSIPIDIVNSGDIAATGTTYRAYGILAFALYDGSAIEILNSGDITVSAGEAGYGISARTGAVLVDAPFSPIAIANSGDIRVTTAGYRAYAYGIRARTYSDDGPIDVLNRGDMLVTTTAGEDADAYGILARAFGDRYPHRDREQRRHAGEDRRLRGRRFWYFGGDPWRIQLRRHRQQRQYCGENRWGRRRRLRHCGGDGWYRQPHCDQEQRRHRGDYRWVRRCRWRLRYFSLTFTETSPIAIENIGDLAITSALSDATGIFTRTTDDNSPIRIVNNSGDIAVTARGNFEAAGIFARIYEDSSRIEIVNDGRLKVRAGNSADGISGLTIGSSSFIGIVNRGDIAVNTRAGPATGVRAFTYGRTSPIDIENKANLVVTSVTSIAFGVNAYTAYHNSPISILNAGNITASGAVSSYGISAVTEGDFSPVDIVNTAKITAGVFGIYAATSGIASPIAIFNAGVIDPEVGSPPSPSPPTARSPSRTRAPSMATLSASARTASPTRPSSIRARFLRPLSWRSLLTAQEMSRSSTPA